MKKVLFTLCILMVGCLGSPTPRDPRVLPGIREKEEKIASVASCTSCAVLEQELITKEGQFRRLSAQFAELRDLFFPDTEVPSEEH